MQEAKDVIDHPRIILCEGAQDASFFRHLIGERRLPPFYIAYPWDKEDATDLQGVRRPGGRQGFHSRLASLKFADKLEEAMGILVVSDSDADPKASFQEVREQILEVDGCAAPNRPSTAARGAGVLPPVAVAMIPSGDTPGSLETLCLESMSQRWPDVARCVDALFVCAGLEDWPQTKREKARLRAMLACACKSDPNTSLVHAWSGDGRPPDLIPLQHPVFDGIAEFLAHFDALVQGAA